MLLAAEPERMHRFLDAVVEVHLKNLERFLGAVGTSIDIISFGDDLGSQHGPQDFAADVPGSSSCRGSSCCGGGPKSWPR